MSFAVRGKKAAYLRAYVAKGSHEKAAKASGTSTTSHYQWLDNDEQYAADFSRACEVLADRYEAALFERGVLGVEKPTGWYKGEPGGYVREYSDTAAIFSLKGLRPDKYADRKHTTVDIDDKRSVAQLQAELTALLERNPDVRKQLGAVVQQDVIEGEFVEGGVGPPNDARVGGIDPSPCSGPPSDQKKPLPGSDYYEQS